MAFTFEKLEVYPKAVDFADEIAALTETFPRGNIPGSGGRSWLWNMGPSVRVGGAVTELRPS